MAPSRSENEERRTTGQSAEYLVADAQLLQNLGPVRLLRRHQGPALQRNINHSLPPGALHSALPTSLKYLPGTHSSGPLAA